MHSYRDVFLRPAHRFCSGFLSLLTLPRISMTASPCPGTLTGHHLPIAASVRSLPVAVVDLNPRGPLLQSALLEKSHCPACSAALGDRELSGSTDPDMLGLGEPMRTVGSAAVSRPVRAAARLLPAPHHPRSLEQQQLEPFQVSYGLFLQPALTRSLAENGILGDGVPLDTPNSQQLPPPLS